MKIKTSLSAIAGLVLVLVLSSFNQKQLLTTPQIREEVKKDFEAKVKLMAKANPINLTKGNLNNQEKDALMFLYAYMPIGDVADYTPDFYVKAVKTTLAARQEMPWGKIIPDDIFMHYVLPVRVNNERLDSARSVIFAELKERVKNMSLSDAVLEVNHWCHEKVVYTPSDARTSAPLASIKTAYGRCGEESTLTVAALRAVGIPARQVYTPRWAHTNDNHAWVEAWVDGKWYFMGACEPEPVLNMGWFNGPAYRSLLMHTRVFGKYHGPEPVITRTSCFTEINVTGTYAPTASVTVTVVSPDNKPVENAEVRYSIYNYSEFYPVTKQLTDKNGHSSFMAGKGDMVVWANKGNSWGYGKVSFGKMDKVTIKLDKVVGQPFSDQFDIVPPVDGSIPVNVTEKQRADNKQRLHSEDLIREAYVKTFISKERCAEIAGKLGVNADTLNKLVSQSRGNWNTILNFLQQQPKQRVPLAIQLLKVISEKDLRDIPGDVLADHIGNTPQNSALSVFPEYTLNPRVANEFVSPYKSVIRKMMPASLTKQIIQDPKNLISWVNNNIKVADEFNPQEIPVTVTGVWKGRVADRQSRDIFFVGVCRSLGIAARIESITGKTQYYHNNKWNDVDFRNVSHVQPAQGSIQATYEPTPSNTDPEYYSHYTLAKYQDGTFNTLDFRFRGGADMEVGTSWSNLLKEPLKVDEGYYMLVSGNRMANGSVLASIKGFNVVKDNLTKTELVMRHDANQVEVIGSVDAECKFKPVNKDKEQSILETSGRGYFVIMLAGSREEPTNHALRALARIKGDLESWKRSIIVLFDGEQQWKNFDIKEFPALPNTITFGIDTNKKVSEMIAKSMKLTETSRLPIIIIADTFGRVVYMSQGYNTTLNDQINSVINKIK